MRIVLFLLSTLLIFSCQSAVFTGEGVKQPEWINNPEYPNHVGVVTSAQPQKVGGIEAQRRVAHIMARAELSKIKESFVESRSTAKTITSESGVLISHDALSRVGTVQALRLNDLKVIEEWIHPETGELFLWLAYPVGH